MSFKIIFEYNDENQEKQTTELFEIKSFNIQQKPIECPFYQYPFKVLNYAFYEYPEIIIDGNEPIMIKHINYLVKSKTITVEL